MLPAFASFVVADRLTLAASATRMTDVAENNVVPELSFCTFARLPGQPQIILLCSFCTQSSVALQMQSSSDDQ